MIYYCDKVFEEKGKVQQNFVYAVYVNFLISNAGCFRVPKWESLSMFISNVKMQENIFFFN
jgi:hypothetical protein